jgi:hypothetical protein
LLATLGLHALHAFSPLRVEYDSTEYLVMAAWIRDGHGIPADAAFPPGLPLLLAGLDSVDLLRSGTVVLVNLAFLAAGLLAVASVLRRDLGFSRAGALAVCTATLLSFLIVRTAARPLSDIPFFGLAWGSVALASASRRRQSHALFAGAVALALAATAVRTIGFALLPTLLVAVPTRRRWTLVAVCLASAVVLAVAGPTRYVSEAVEEWRDGPFAVFATHLWDLARALGEVGINAPQGRVPDALASIYPAVGMLLLVPVAAGAWLLRNRAPVAIAFLASITAVLFVWPFVDARLLLPVVPLLIVCAVEAVGIGVRARRSVLLAGAAWCTVFVACSIAVFAVSLRMTFSGDRFPEVYNPYLRETYRVAWGTAEAGPHSGVEPRALWALRRYEPRAIGDPGPTPRP